MIPAQLPPPILALLFMTLFYPFFLHYLLLRWFSYYYRNFISLNYRRLLYRLKDYNEFFAPVYCCFAMGIFNIVVWLPLTILLTPVYLVVLLYATVYWIFRSYIIQ